MASSDWKTDDRSHWQNGLFLWTPPQLDSRTFRRWSLGWLIHLLRPADKKQLAGKKRQHEIPNMNLKPLLVPVLALLSLLASPEVLASGMLVGNVRVINVQGSSAELLTSAGKKSPLREGMFIQQGSKILTGSDSTVSLVFENGSSLQIEPSSQFSIDEFVQDPFEKQNLDYKSLDKAPTSSVTKISIPEGAIIFNVAKQKSGSSFNISTPVGVAGIRGTSGTAGAQGFGLATGSASFTPPGGTQTNIGAGQFFNPGTGIGSLPPGLQQSIATTTQSIASNTPQNTFAGSPPNLTPQQHSAIQAATAQGGAAVAQVAAQLAAQNPEAAAEIAAAAAYSAPDAAPQIAGTVSQAVPSAAVEIAQTVSQVVPQQAQNVAQAIVSAVPGADASAVQQAAQQGAQQSSQPATQGQGNQPLSTGDQGTITAGQQLPGTGTGGGASGNPRPTPGPSPTPTSR